MGRLVLHGNGVCKSAIVSIPRAVQENVMRVALSRRGGALPQQVRYNPSPTDTNNTESESSQQMNKDTL